MLKKKSPGVSDVGVRAPGANIICLRERDLLYFQSECFHCSDSI